MTIERVVARGYGRRVEADTIRTRFERDAIVNGKTGLTFFVRRVDGRWSVFERKPSAPSRY